MPPEHVKVSVVIPIAFQKLYHDGFMGYSITYGGGLPDR